MCGSFWWNLHGLLTIGTAIDFMALWSWPSCNLLVSTEYNYIICYWSVSDRVTVIQVCLSGKSILTVINVCGPTVNFVSMGYWLWFDETCMGYWLLGLQSTSRHYGVGFAVTNQLAQSIICFWSVSGVTEVAHPFRFGSLSSPLLSIGRGNARGLTSEIKRNQLVTDLSS